jgi:hypothetical protein
VHLLGPRGVADGDVPGGGDAVPTTGERVPVVVGVAVGVLGGGPVEEAELVGGAERGEAGEGERPAAVAPGGRAVEEEVAEEVVVAGGRRRVDGDVVEAVRGREARPGRPPPPSNGARPSARLDREEGARRWRGPAPYSLREAVEEEGEEGEEGCAWWRSGGGGGLGLVESIYINITMNVDRPIARSTAPSDQGVGGLT